MYKRSITLKFNKFHEFKCIGDKCEDNCCHGWRVTIDKKTYKAYKNVKDKQVSKYISSNIVLNNDPTTKFDYSFIRNNQDGKCPFLNEQGLCYIHGNLGEKYLSNTCSTYPRFYNLVGDIMEHSLYVSCPEVVRILLFDDKKVEFLQQEEKFNMELGVNVVFNQVEDYKDLNNYFWPIRIFTIETIQNRDYELWQRLIILGLAYDKINQSIKNNREQEIEQIVNSYREKIYNLSFKDSFSKIPSNEDVQLRLAKAIMEVKTLISSYSPVFNDLHNKLLEGIDFNENDIYNIEKYKMGLKGFSEYIKEKSYVFENYLVYHVFSNAFDINEKDLFEAYCVWILHYSILKLYLSGLYAHYGYINDEIVTNLVYSFTREIDHNGAFIKSIVDILKNGGKESYLTMAYMAILIKN